MTSISAPDLSTPRLSGHRSADAHATARPRETPLTARRNETIDVIRLFAAAGVVFVHAAKSPSLEGVGHFFRFAVPFYLFASLYFQSLSLRRGTDRTLPQYIAGRFKRLYLPFLAWSAIYLVARDVRRIMLLHLPPVQLEPGLLWRGIAYHLWFLPFLLGWSIILAVIHWGLLRHNRQWRWPLIAVAIAAGFALAFAHMPSSWDENFDNPTYAYVQWWRSLPATCWALAFAWFMTMGPVAFAVSPIVGLAGIALAAACSLTQAFRGIQLIPRGLSGLGCMVAALAPWSGTAASTMARLGRYSYGVYLCHVLVVEVVRAVVAHTRLAPSALQDLVIFALGFAGSMAVVFALSHSKKLAWLNG